MDELKTNEHGDKSARIEAQQIFEVILLSLRKKEKAKSEGKAERKEKENEGDKRKTVMNESSRESIYTTSWGNEA